MWFSLKTLPSVPPLQTPTTPPVPKLIYSSFSMAKETQESEYKAHIVLFPLMAQGHIIPMIDMARLLAQRPGVLTTFVTTPINAARSLPAISSILSSSLPVRFLELPFPCSAAGLPDGCENIDLIPFPDTEDLDLLRPVFLLIKNFFFGTALLRDPLLSLLLQQHPSPTCIIADVCLPWLSHVAEALRIPRFIFHGQCCFSLACYLSIHLNGLDRTITDETQRFLVPGLPQPIHVDKTEAPGFFSMPGWEKLRKDTIDAELSSDGVVLNTFNALEGEYVEYYEKTLGKRALAIGPVSLANRDVSSMAMRGNKTAIDEQQCLNWLDSKDPRSAIFVSFGSLALIKPLQLMEIGYGLEASGSPFIWVIKECEKWPEMEQWVAELKERTGHRSLIIIGWAPQVVILSHVAIGGFLTHCGWNSVLEAVSAGVVMATWPRNSDQFLNEKLVVEALRIGVRVGGKPPSYVAMSKWNVVERNAVEKVVRCLMDKGKEGEERRERARELGVKASMAMEEGGSSYVDLTKLIDLAATVHVVKKGFHEN
ncbi:putative trans-zeatin O-beta-D-glucosyltransferase [Dioscorea sansibarensis]